MKRFVFSLLFVVVSVQCLVAQTGVLRGRVLDKTSQQPLMGVNVIVKDTELGAATDMNGEYIIEVMNVGGYTLEFSFIGYQKKAMPDVFVKSNKIVYANTELTQEVLQGETITVSAGYFEESEESPVSVQTLSYEEIRRSPGTREDVSRMLQNLPGVNPSNDDRNDLIIRGGSPTEVLYILDHIEIPNPNHFGTQGATGGPVSMINTEFVEDMKFMAGGFIPEYGHKLSGVMDIRLREGNRHGYNGKLDLNFGGAGGYFEGPIKNGRGSFLLGVHRSFLDILEGILDYGGVPIYSNIQGKIVYDLNPRHQWSMLWLGGDDRIFIDDEVDMYDFRMGIVDTVDYQPVEFKSRQFTVGSNLRSFWHEKFYTNLNVSHTYNRFFTDVNTIEIAGRRVMGKNELQNKQQVAKINTYDNISTEQVSCLKVDANYLMNPNNTLTFGSYIKLNQFDHEIIYEPYDPDDINSYGRKPTPQSTIVTRDPSPKYGAYVHFKQRILNRLVYHIGGRYDYFDLLKEGNFSPRFNLRFDVTHRLDIHAGVGTYYQNPELIWITSDPQNQKMLKDMQCDHLIAGLNYLLSPDTRLTIEGYQKEYSQYPVSADDGYEMISLANTGADYGNNSFANKLVSEGEGRATGIEFMVQKKMSGNWYGLLSYSWSRIEHKALDGVFRPGQFDNQNVFNLVLGFRLSKFWEVSTKWRYAGGTPYTPYDVDASIAAGAGRLDLERINDVRYADYQRLDLRVDHREYFKKGTLIEYVSIENVFGRKNIRDHYWSNLNHKTKFHYQTGFFIIGGVSYEF